MREFAEGGAGSRPSSALWLSESSLAELRMSFSGLGFNGRCASAASGNKCSDYDKLSV